MNTYNNIVEDFFNNLNNIGSNPIILVILICIIVVYYIVFAFLGKGNSESSSSNIGFIFIEALLWGVFIILILVNGLIYFFDLNIITEIKNIFGNKPEIEIKSIIEKTKQAGGELPNNIHPNSELAPEPVNSEEVYHIPGNKFTYHDAKAICKAFDANIATFEQMDVAQKNGASWCNYGWSQDQLGLYPTSKNDFEKLKKREGSEYDCGLPGINGGYVANPHIKLGANCYGVKPKESELEKQYLKNNDILPKNKKDVLFEERVEYWKKRLGNILLLPFNNKSWYKI
tara:strand:+ start:2702 stop:3559 length:858 start_codon:yes stop_codon:yes gene_type:complete